MEEKASPPSLASARSLFTLIVFYILGGLLIVSCLSLAFLSLSRLHKSSQYVSRNKLPLLQANQEVLNNISDAKTVLSKTLDVDQPQDFNHILEDQASLNQVINKVSTLLSAMTWGSSSEAFSKSSGGLNKIEWQRLGYASMFTLEPASDSEAKLIGYASINFAGFANNSSRSVAARRQAIQFAQEGRTEEAETARVAAVGFTNKQLVFLDYVSADIGEVDKLARQEVQEHVSYTDNVWAANQRALPLLALLGLIGSITFGLIFTRKQIINPLVLLQDKLNRISAGKILEQEAAETEGPLGGLTAAFNLALNNLQGTTRNLSGQLFTKKDELAKKSENYEQTKKAMINLLSDARNLEAELKSEKANVEHKIVERTAELQAEKSRLSASVNSLSAGFIMTDDKQNVRLINPLALRILFGPDHQQSEAKIKFEDIKKQFNDQLDFAAKVEKCLSTKETQKVDELFFNDRFLHIYFTPIIDNKSAAIGAVVLIQDETEQKVIQRSKDEFFSIASHELRTPLTAIRGNTSMIQSYYPEILKQPDLKEMIDDIHSSAVRLIEIVNDFLDASRLEQGKVDFKTESFSIDKIIESVIYEMAGVSTEKHITIKHENTLGLTPEVYADQDKVKQIIYNLVGNAMKFTENGSITISLEPLEQFLKVLIVDTGKGISAEKQSLLFHKFQQAGESLYTRDTTRGTGLGLYISKLLCEKMGGKIALEKSEPGKGTTFSFTLPLATAHQKQQTTDDAAALLEDKPVSTTAT